MHTCLPDCWCVWVWARLQDGHKRNHRDETRGESRPQGAKGGGDVVHRHKLLVLLEHPKGEGDPFFLLWLTFDLGPGRPLASSLSEGGGGAKKTDLAS